MLKIYLPALIFAVLLINPVRGQEMEGILSQTRTPIRPQIPENINPSAVSVTRLHYGGGGDWYWGSSALPNLLDFIRANSNMPVDTIEHVVQIMDDNLFRFPFLFATGHGIMKFTDDEKTRLLTFLTNGGFLFINDSYGMDKNVRKVIADLFPERELVELPFDHPIYHSYYDFPGGPPKIHEHDGKPAQGFGIIINGRVVLYYLYESDIGDGWEDPQVHNDPPEKREEALKMGTNLLVYALTH
ncbi:conserved hypothetical protein [Candidatus Zixiibacteriota bacterium]|nr:conserved hypothetical protein [candidate division Zixibacteria bacterium]